MKSLVVIETQKQAAEWLRKIREESPSLDHVTPLISNFKAERIFEEARRSFKVLEDYPIGFDIQELQDASFILADGWYQIPALHHSLGYEKCSLGLIVQRDLTYYLFALLYNLSLADAILREERPDEIHVFEIPDRPLKNYGEFRGTDEDGVFARIFRDRAQGLGIHVRTCPPSSLRDGRRPAKQSQKRGSGFAISKSEIASPAKRFGWLAKTVLLAAFKNVLSCLWGTFPRFEAGPAKGHRILMCLTPDYALAMGRRFRKEKDCRAFYLTEELPIKPFPRFLKLRIDILLARPSRKTNHPSPTEMQDLYARPDVQAQLEEYFRTKDYDLWPFISRRFDFLFETYFRDLTALVDFFKRLLIKNQISAVIVNEDVREFNRALVLVAKTLRVPTLVLQHGVVGKKPGFYPVVADKFACWGSYHRDRLLEWNIPGDKIAITGCPKYEDWRLSPGALDRKSEFCREFKLDPGKKLVLYTNTIFREAWKVDDVDLRFTPRQVRSHIEGLIREMRKLPNYQLVIKLHPRDKHLGFIEETVESLGAQKEVLILQFYPAFQLLEAVDIIVDPAWSSMNLEALVLEKPLLRLNLDHRIDLFDFNERGVAIGLDDLNQLPQALKAALELPKQPQFKRALREVLEEQLWGVGSGKPSERVASLVLELSSGRIQEYAGSLS